MLRVDVTIAIMISVGLGSIIRDSISRHSLEWKFIGIFWVLWGSKWSSLSEGFPSSVILGVNITIAIVIFVSLRSVIRYSISGDSLEWELVRILRVLRSRKWSSLGETFTPSSVMLRVFITISIMISVCLGSIILSFCSRHSFEWKLVGV